MGDIIASVFAMLVALAMVVGTTVLVKKKTINKIVAIIFYALAGAIFTGGILSIIFR